MLHGAAQSHKEAVHVAASLLPTSVLAWTAHMAARFGHVAVVQEALARDGHTPEGVALRRPRQTLRCRAFARAGSDRAHNA